MEVILIKQVPTLGQLGDTVTVRPGYARNYLIPQGMALPATKKSRLEFQAKKEELLRAQEALHQKALERIAAIDSLIPLEIYVKSGAEGRLFGAVAVKDIIDALLKKDFLVEKKELDLPGKYLKQLGDYEVVFTPHGSLDHKLSKKIPIRILEKEGNL